MKRNYKNIYLASASLLSLLLSEASFAQQTLPAINVGADRRTTNNDPNRPRSGAGLTRATPSTTQSSPGNATGGSDAPGFGSGKYTNATFGRGPTGVDNYFASGTFSSTRTNTRILDIPQAVNIITEKQLQDRAVFDIRQSLQYTPGVTVEQGEGSRDQILIRGQNTTADFFVDGIRDDAEYIRDIYNIDSVEVLKGPSALIFGRGGGGGVINRVTKKADFNTIRNATVYAGSFGQKRVVMDVGQAVNSDFAVRVSSMYENSYGYRDKFKLEKWGISPAFTWRPMEKTYVTLNYEHFSDRRTADRGVPSFGGLWIADEENEDVPKYVIIPGKPWAGPRYSFYGGNFNVVRNTVDAVRIVQDHTFDSGLNFHNQTAIYSYGRMTKSAFPDDELPGVSPDFTVALRGYENNKPRQNVFNRTDWTYDWQMTSDIKHTILAGSEFGNQVSYDNRNRGYWNDPIPDRANRTLNVSVLQPTAYNSMYFTEMQRRRRTNLDLAAGYVQDQIALTKNVDLLAGVRFDSFNLRYQNNLDEEGFYTTGLGATYQQRVDNVWSPRFGLVVKPTDKLSFYGTYSKSFLPAAGDQFTRLDGELVSGEVDPQRLAPQSFTNYEVGFKAELNSRLLFTGALYQLARTNQIIEYVDDYNVQVGTLTKGGELGLVGNITDEWTVSWGYGIQNAKITNSDQSFVVGKTVPSVPLNTATFWSKYDVSSILGLSPDTLGFGAGTIYNSMIFAAPDNAVEIPGYVRVDAAAYLKINERISGQVNVENIGGANYWVSAHRNNLITPGAPRSALVTLNVKF